MHLYLGQWLGQRFEGFLGPDYSEKEVYVRSTDLDRTLMSAQANMAGLFPVTPKMEWMDSMHWQPVPVHTVLLSEDRLLTDSPSCPRAAKLKKEVQESPEVQKLLNKNKELLDFLSFHAGRDMYDLVNLDHTYDTLFIESLYNKTLPEWTKGVFPGGPFKMLRDFSFTLDSATPELARMSAGPFLEEVLRHWHKVDMGVEMGGNDTKLLYVYSSHDTKVASLLNALKMFNGIAPPYAAAVIMELLEADTEMVVRFAYRNDTEHAPYVLTLPGCEELCPLHRFKDLTSSLLPTLPWEAQCSLEDDSPFPSLITFDTFPALVLLAFIIVLVLLVYTKRASRKKAAYQSL